MGVKGVLLFGEVPELVVQRAENEFGIVEGCWQHKRVHL